MWFSYLKDKLDANGESGHVDREFAIGDPAVEEIHNNALTVDYGWTQSNFGYQTHGPHGHLFGVTYLSVM